ncbi:MAG: glycosyltransferase family 1 protein [Patescibacteria group bacterium]
MVIGVDAGTLSVTDDRLKVGVYRVTQEALRELIRVDMESEYRLYSFGKGVGEIGGIREMGGDKIKEIILPRVGWSKVWLPIELKKRAPDAFLGFAQALPSISTLCDIGFIYDLGFLYHPEAYGTSAKTLKIQTDNLVRRSDHIITISSATKADLTREYGLPTEKITVAYPGVDPSFSPAGEKFVGSRPYFLFVGSLNKAKDIPTLLKSFAVVNGYDLYFVGGNYWPDPEIDETIEKFHLGDRIKKLGVLPDAELPKYYRGALAFVTTALQEGFCLPAAEAMACGTPVVALGRGALAEVVGKAGIIVSTQADLPKAMMKMTDGKGREAFSKRAIMQAKKFRWEEFARHILNCIHNGYKKD